jgi:hypothetical protein
MFSRMAKSAALFPSWVWSLDRAIADGGQVRAFCTRCRAARQVDLRALRARVGGDYCLVNRRCRCRLTPGCAGWNRFHYLHGVYRPLWDDATAERWIVSG